MNERIAVIIFCSVAIVAWLAFVIWFIIQRKKEKQEEGERKKKD